MEYDYTHQDLTSEIIRCFYNVYNKLGYGFLEKVYERSMIIEMSNQGLFVESQKPIEVLYDGVVVGEYFADLVVDDSVILELKAAQSICEEHEIQLVNYLKATSHEVGLLLNFGKKPEIRRKVFSNMNK